MLSSPLLFQRFTTQPTMKLAKLPKTRPPVRQNPASDPAMSFSSSSIAGFNEGEEAMIMLSDEIQLRSIKKNLSIRPAADDVKNWQD